MKKHLRPLCLTLCSLILFVLTACAGGPDENSPSLAPDPSPSGMQTPEPASPTPDSETVTEPASESESETETEESSKPVFAAGAHSLVMTQGDAEITLDFSPNRLSIYESGAAAPVHYALDYSIDPQHAVHGCVTADINFDGATDFYFPTLVGEAEVFLFYLWDAASAEFAAAPAWSVLTQPVVDSERRRLYASSYTDITRLSRKVYAVEGRQLIPEEEFLFALDRQTLTHIVYENGAPVSETEHPLPDEAQQARLDALAAGLYPDGELRWFGFGGYTVLEGSLCPVFTMSDTRRSGVSWALHPDGVNAYLYESSPLPGFYHLFLYETVLVEGAVTRPRSDALAEAEPYDAASRALLDAPQQRIYDDMLAASAQGHTLEYSGESQWADVAEAYRALTEDNPALALYQALTERRDALGDQTALVFERENIWTPGRYALFELSNVLEQLDTAVARYAPWAQAELNQYELYELLALTVGQLAEPLDSAAAPEDDTIYGVFINGRATALGYARAFRYLCQRYGLYNDLFALDGRVYNLIMHSGDMYAVQLWQADRSAAMPGDSSWQAWFMTTEPFLV